MLSVSLNKTFSSFLFNLASLFVFNSWVGANKKSSFEEKLTLPLSRTQPSPVASPAKDLPLSRGDWQVRVWTGEAGTRGAVEDLAVVMCGDKRESQMLVLNSNRKKPFEAGQVDVCKVRNPSMQVLWTFGR